jgi:hypothetical protein
MASRKNFQNKYTRSSKSDDVFTRPKEMVLASQLDEKRRNRLKDWITFYRRNIQYFVKHYLGIKLHFYQSIWIYLMAVSDSFVAICSRATGKSWLLAVFACAKAILYPRSEIVICSSTKEQAGIIVGDKIVSLMAISPNLSREISNITTNANKWQVDFHNGSIIKVVAARDSSRGRRSTFTIYEEFRLIDKDVVDAVIRPFSYIRQAEYLSLPEYENVNELIEEPKEVFISSAYHKGLWWYDETKKNLKDMLKGKNSMVMCLDYSLALKHRIKTSARIRQEKSKMDDITALEEYDNIPWGENANAYFRLSMFEKLRKIDKAFYPQRNDSYDPKKNPYDVVKKKEDGEIRVISCDIASRGGSANDLAVTSCFRLLPTRKGYTRELVYMESFSGKDTISQGLRIKQIWKDFLADYIVLDVANIGISVYEQLGIVTKDAERGDEYPAMTVMIHSTIDQKDYDELLNHTTSLNALPIIYPITASAKLNSQIAVEMRDKLQRKLFAFLLSDTDAETYLLANNKEYANPQTDSDIKARILAPYVQTNFLINESINLEMTLVSGNVKLDTATATARKDRYSSVSYGNFFISLLDKQLLHEEDDSDDYEILAALAQGWG